MVELVEFPLNTVAYIIAAKQLTQTFLYVLNSYRPYLIPGILSNLILLKRFQEEDFKVFRVFPEIAMAITESL